MSNTVQIVYAMLLSYFLVLNLGTIGFVLMAVGENRLRQRQAQYTNFDRLIGSDATIAVSVIVPAYNEEAVIRDTVLSVLGSRHPQFELIVVNDGSTDNTMQVSARAARRVLSPADQDSTRPQRLPLTPPPEHVGR